ncbi:MAG: HAMP domain-containing sensor histidine kinase [Actinomycetota bacterium]
MRLQTRLALVFGALGLVTVSAVSSTAYVLSADEVRDSVDAELQQRLGPFIALRAGGFGDVDQRPDVIVNDTTGEELLPIDTERARATTEAFLTDPSAFEAQGDTTRLRILWSDGTFTGGPGASPTDAALESLDETGQFLETIDIGGVPFRVLTGAAERELPSVDGRSPIGIQLLRDITNEEQSLDDLAVRLALVSGVAVAILVVTSLVVGRWLSRPITRLSATAEALADLDDVPARVEVRRSDEIGQMADSYNRLLAAIEVGREQQRRLVADASHELRTPLTSLRMRLEHLQGDGIEQPRRDEILAGAVDDCEQLSVLASDLVDLAAAIRSADEAPEPERLGDLARDVAARVAQRTGREVVVEADDAVVEVRPTMIRRALQNLLDNAAKYSIDGPIAVRSTSGRIEVRDHGPGIPDDDLDHVFDRFFRSPKARTRPGNGIGLAIVREVAEVHGGTAWAHNDPAGGAVVGFSVGSSVG